MLDKLVEARIARGGPRTADRMFVALVGLVAAALTAMLVLRARERPAEAAVAASALALAWIAMAPLVSADQRRHSRSSGRRSVAVVGLLAGLVPPLATLGGPLVETALIGSIDGLLVCTLVVAWRRRAAQRHHA
jgi:uncharacterized membrane protein YfcA